MSLLALLLLSLLVTSAAGLSLVTRKFMPLSPIKSAMLIQKWQGQLAEADMKVGDVGAGEVGVLRFGPELERRTACKRSFEEFQAAALALATADKSEDPIKNRNQIPALQEIAGANRGENAKCFTSLCLTGGGCNTMALVECGGDTWSVLSLAVAPEERNLEIITEAEAATLCELRNTAAAEAGASLRVKAALSDVGPQSTLVGSAERLGLVPWAGDTNWLEVSDECCDGK